VEEEESKKKHILQDEKNWGPQEKENEPRKDRGCDESHDANEL